MKLRDYQNDAIAKARQSYINGNKSILICSPTGSGKSVILAEIIKSASAGGKKVLFLVHRREIIFQIQDYLKGYDIDHGIILSGEEFTDGHNVNIATVQTLHSRMKRRYYKKADVIIIDEAHHGTSRTYLEVINAHRDNLVLGFTATPCRKNGLGLGHLFDDLIVVETISKLTEDGFLVPVRYYAPSEPDLEKVKISAGDYNLKQLDKVMSAPKLVGDVIENWLHIGEGRQTIVFTTTVKHSVAVCEAFNTVGITAEHVSGKTPKDERREIIDRFKDGDTRILCNCAVFTEGVDIPEISCVVMARPTKSLALYMQCIGRGMRPCIDKKDMIFIDHAGACLEHGRVDEITDWYLDKNNTNPVNEKRKERKSQPIECKMCGLVYTKQLKCPQCGHIPEVKEYGEEADFIDAELGEVFMKKPKVEEPIKRDKNEWYAQFLGYAQSKGYSQGWAWHKMKEVFGSCPRQKPTPQPAGADVKAYIRKRNAQYHLLNSIRSKQPTK